jgi:hypothetical protein
MIPAETIKARYDRGANGTRRQYLDRARDCAALTIPRLVPQEGDNAAKDYPNPWQSLGATGINSLAAKLVTSIFPPAGTTSFFRMAVDEMTLEKMSNQEGLRSEVEKATSRAERAIGLRMEDAGIRAPLQEGLKYTLVAGNILIYIEPGTGRMKLYRLDRFVTKRSPNGKPLEIITHDTMSRAELSPEVIAIIGDKANQAGGNTSHDDTIHLYTQAKRTLKGMWEIRQEIEGKAIPFSDGQMVATEPADKGRYIIVAPLLIPGEDYARSFCDEYYADLMNLEALAKAVTEAAAAAARVIPLVNPNGMTNIEDLMQAENGQPVSGRKDDVSFMQLEKFADLNFVNQQIERIERRLARAFMLAASVTRDAERVTAQEIRVLTAELEQTLGGIYSALAQTLQKPLVECFIQMMTMSGELPALPPGLVKVVVITGIEGLGRSMDLQKLDQVFMDVARFGPEVQQEYLNMSDYFQRRCAALGVDAKGLVRTEDEVNAKRQQAMEQQMAMQAAPAMAQQAMEQQ